MDEKVERVNNKIDTCQRQIEKLHRSFEKKQRELMSLKLKRASLVYGVDIGSLVRCQSTGKSFRVMDMRVESYEEPILLCSLVKKDGSLSSSVRRVYDWELAEGRSSD